MKLINVKFIGLEFDFDYSEEAEKQHNLGRIDAKVFVELDNEGSIQVEKHEIRIDEVSYLDFMSEKEIQELNFGKNFGSTIQKLRQLIAMKIASDLGVELSDSSYIVKKSNKEEVDTLKQSQADQDEAIMMLMLGGL